MRNITTELSRLVLHWKIITIMAVDQTAAARGAPRHDQQRVVWDVYDETTRRGVNTYPACIHTYM